METMVTTTTGTEASGEEKDRSVPPVEAHSRLLDQEFLLTEDTETPTTFMTESRAATTTDHQRDITSTMPTSVTSMTPQITDSMTAREATEEFRDPDKNRVNPAPVFDERRWLGLSRFSA